MKNDRADRLLRQITETEVYFGGGEMPKGYLKIPRSEPQSKTPGPALVEAPDWENTENEIRSCAKCALSQKRTKVVFGEGNRNADLLFVGEAPGYDEDIQGRPFVGKAGQLLTRIIQAMGLKREDVYIANCIKCRPPQNRNPLPEEVAACNVYLRNQIAWIQPRVICALGKFAAQTLLSSDAAISRMRGRFHELDGIRVMPTFHPAYLLRNPADKKLVWSDIKQIMRELSLSDPAVKP